MTTREEAAAKALCAAENIPWTGVDKSQRYTFTADAKAALAAADAVMFSAENLSRIATVTPFSLQDVMRFVRELRGNEAQQQPYAKGGVVEGSIPVNLMVRHLPSNDYREYWDAELGQWVRIFTWEQIRDFGTRALEDLNRAAGNG